MSRKWRIIIDGKKDGFYNMAADEAILHNYPIFKIPTLRIYSWSGPFITLGYRQRIKDTLNIKLLSMDKMPIEGFTRRITGGSAIFHDKEITYSMICSPSDLDLPIKVKDSYRVICSFIIDFYLRLGLNVKFARDIFPRSLLGNYGSFCFSSFEEFDLIINEKKIGGNAQRRRKDKIFQQGSIPQKVDFESIKKIIQNSQDAEVKSAGLDSLLNRKTSYLELSSILKGSFQRVFNLEAEEGFLKAEEVKSLNTGMEDKYRNKEWIFSR